MNRSSITFSSCLYFVVLSACAVDDMSFPARGADNSKISTVTDVRGANGLELPISNLDLIFQNDPATLALLEFDGDVHDTSGNDRSPTLLGGTFEPTPWGMGLRLSGADPQGLDWSAYAGLLQHPYTIEMVVTPDSVNCWAKLFGANDTTDDGWYYCDGFQAFPNATVTNGGITAGTRQYLALVSTSPTTMDVYFQGIKIGSTASAFTSPPGAAIFFRDDSGTSRREQLSGIVEAMRISNVSRSSTEIAMVEDRLNGSVFHPDQSTLALLEFNGDVRDTSGNGRSPTLLGGTFEATLWGAGLRLPDADPQGLDWSAYAGLLQHPYTVEMVVTPDSVNCWAKLFGANDATDSGWYYCDGFQAFPNATVTNGGITAGTRQYLALVSTSSTTMDVYFQGAQIGSTASAFMAPPSSAIFFRDDSITSRSERISGVIEAMRISSVSRTKAEIAAVQDRLDSVFRNDPATLALLEFNGDVRDTSGNGRSPTLLGGTFEPTSWGMGLRLAGTDPQGIDWSAYARLLQHPYTVEMVVTPDSVNCWAKLFGANDAADIGWYYCDGFRVFPNPAVTSADIVAGTRHYFALVSTSPTTMDVYFQGVKIGSTTSAFTTPPGAAIFFRDDSITSRHEQLRGIVEAMRISSVGRSSAEIAAVQSYLMSRP